MTKPTTFYYVGFLFLIWYTSLVLSFSSISSSSSTNSINTTTDSNSKKQIPITVLSGFLGSGKTTLLHHLLTNKQGLRIAVIVNDVASVNIDSKLIGPSSSSSSWDDDDDDGENDGTTRIGTAAASGIIELQNGCACCSLSDELLTSVSELVTLSDLRGDEDGFHHIVVELSGVADPKSIRSKFQEAEYYQMPLMERVQLDTLITVVDSSSFLQYLLSSKTASPTETPELFGQSATSHDDNSDDTVPERQEWMDSVPAPLLEALMENDNNGDSSYYFFDEESANGVADLLVSQLETADVILLNKVDLVDDSVADDTEQIVRAMNPRANVVRTEYGIVPVADVLAVAAGEGVVAAGVVDDHRDAIKAAMATKQQDQQHSLSTECKDPDCTDSNHSHSHHSHSHDHAHTSSPSTTNHDDTKCDDLQCTDPSHSHSHTHSHHHNDDEKENECNDPTCNDPSHTHSHSHDHQQHAGIGTFVYQSRKPFHPHRLLSFLRKLPVVRGLPEEKVDEVHVDTSNESNRDDDVLEISKESQSTLKSILRSKGFLWCADSNIKALYWSHAGPSFDMQCIGRWWTTLPRSQWPEEAVSTILSDFDDPDHQEGDDAHSKSVGDRRQEIVFIGPDIANRMKQVAISESLDKCLLTDEEWDTFRSNINDENELCKVFPNPIDARMVSY